YFTSDGTGANNIFSLDLGSGTVTQHTNSVTGCFTPTLLSGPEGKESLVFGAYWKGAFDLYRLDIEEPITEPAVVTEEQIEQVVSLRAEDLPRFEPSIEVSIDDSNKDKYGGGRFFLENISGGTIGLSDDQTFIASVAVQFSDYLGDRKIIGVFQSVESFQNFDVFYLNLKNRLQWQAHLFDDRDFFRTRDVTGRVRRDQKLLSTTGAIASLIYPLGTNHRVEAGVGYILRDLDFTLFADIPVEDITTFDLDRLLELRPDLLDLPPEVQQALLEQVLAAGFVPVPVVEPRKDDFPLLQAAMVGATAGVAPWGAVSGRRWRIGGSWSPDLDDSGTLTSSISLDFRQYLSLTRRSNLAFRLVGFLNDGNSATPIFFGGLDTVRGFEFRSLSGDRGFFSNVELRFPLIDQFATPIIRFQGIRGVLFFDIGGAWFDDFEDFDFYDSENDRCLDPRERGCLEDAVASFGFGGTIRLFGLDLNFDFAKQWDFESSSPSYESSFWIGRRF
ncbi:MAG: BamA/TamA family outer membrane protein, partial [Thermoanaerobaculia bacterium]